MSELKELKPEVKPVILTETQRKFIYAFTPLARSVQWEAGVEKNQSILDKTFAYIATFSSNHDQFLKPLCHFVFDMVAKKKLEFKVIKKDEKDLNDKHTKAYFLAGTNNKPHQICIYSTGINNEESIPDTAASIVHESVHLLAEIIKNKDEDRYDTIFNEESLDEFYTKLPEYKLTPSDTEIMKLLSTISNDLMIYDTDNGTDREELLAFSTEAVFLESTRNLKSRDNKNFLAFFPTLQKNFLALQGEIVRYFQDQRLESVNPVSEEKIKTQTVLETDKTKAEENQKKAPEPSNYGRFLQPPPSSTTSTNPTIGFKGKYDTLETNTTPSLGNG